MTAALAVLAVAAVHAAGTALRPRPVRSAPSAPKSVAAARQHRPVNQRWSARNRRATVDRDYPAAVDLVILAIRAGHLPLAGIRSALPHLPLGVQPAFAEVVARCDAGERFADALATLPAALGLQAAPLADSLAAADRYGLPLAPVLERLASEAHQRRRRRADALARQLPVRLAAPLVLCTLPSFFLLTVIPLLLAALSSLHR